MVYIMREYENMVSVPCESKLNHRVNLTEPFLIIMKRHLICDIIDHNDTLKGEGKKRRKEGKKGEGRK